MKKIYLSGAMQAYEGSVEKAKKWRDDVKKYFDDPSIGFQCISPLDYYRYDENFHKTTKEVMNFELRCVQNSDVVLVNLRDIRMSIGTCDEVFYAYILNKPIIGFIDENMDEKELEQYVHEWKYLQIDRIETGEDALVNACEYIRHYCR